MHNSSFLIPEEMATRKSCSAALILVRPSSASRNCGMPSASPACMRGCNAMKASTTVVLPPVGVWKREADLGERDLADLRASEEMSRRSRDSGRARGTSSRMALALGKGLRCAGQGEAGWRPWRPEAPVAPTRSRCGPAPPPAPLPQQTARRTARRCGQNVSASRPWHWLSHYNALPVEYGCLIMARNASLSGRACPPLPRILISIPSYLAK